jgi:hypothetical protein
MNTAANRITVRNGREKRPACGCNVRLMALLLLKGAGHDAAIPAKGMA